MNPARHQHTWHYLQSLQPLDNLHHVSMHGHGGPVENRTEMLYFQRRVAETHRRLVLLKCPDCTKETGDMGGLSLAIQLAGTFHLCLQTRLLEHGETALVYLPNLSGVLGLVE